MNRGILREMATLRDQRRMVKSMLAQITAERTHQQEIGEEVLRQEKRNMAGVRINVPANPIVRDVESVFERFVEMKDAKHFKSTRKLFGWNSLHYNDKLERARMVAASCLTDGVIVEVGDGEIDWESYGYKISETKGFDLLYFSRYWFKYIPELFPMPTGVLAAVIQSILTAALTSFAIWAFILHHLI